MKHTRCDLLGFVNPWDQTPAFLVPVVSAQGAQCLVYDATDPSVKFGTLLSAQTHRPSKMVPLQDGTPWTRLDRPTPAFAIETHSLFGASPSLAIIVRNSDVGDLLKAVLATTEAEDPFVRLDWALQTMDSQWVAPELRACLSFLIKQKSEAEASKWLTSKADTICEIIPRRESSAAKTISSLASIGPDADEVANYESRAEALNTAIAAHPKPATVKWADVRRRSNSLIALAELLGGDIDGAMAAPLLPSLEQHGSKDLLARYTKSRVSKAMRAALDITPARDTDRAEDSISSLPGVSDVLDIHSHETHLVICISERLFVETAFTGEAGALCRRLTSDDKLIVVLKTRDIRQGLVEAMNRIASSQARDMRALSKVWFVTASELPFHGPSWVCALTYIASSDFKNGLVVSEATSVDAAKLRAFIITAAHASGQYDSAERLLARVAEEQAEASSSKKVRMGHLA